jgi:hypothetical protein
MSRGFDGFDREDFWDSDWRSGSENEFHTLESFGFGREIGRGSSVSSSDPGARLRMQKLRDAESASDRAVMPEHRRKEMSRARASQDSRQVGSLRETGRARYTDRDRSYSLRTSEIQTLTELGKFRVVSVEDLARFAYAGDRERLRNDLRNLTEQGLVQRRGTSAFKKESRQVLTLTKQGERLIRRLGFVPEDQAVYSGLVKPKEADHDSALFKLYQKAAAEIESKGGKVLRVQLDYELKEQLYRRLGRAKLRDKNEAFHLKNGFAQQLYLPVVNGKVSFPDLRIEYANQEMEIGRVDLELATGHYHAGHLADKARAGFQIYARAEDVSGLRRVRDDREIMTSILSL